MMPVLFNLVYLCNFAARLDRITKLNKFLKKYYPAGIIKKTVTIVTIVTITKRVCDNSIILYYIYKYIYII